MNEGGSSDSGGMISVRSHGTAVFEFLVALRPHKKHLEMYLDDSRGRYKHSTHSATATAGAKSRLTAGLFHSPLDSFTGARIFTKPPVGALGSNPQPAGSGGTAPSPTAPRRRRREGCGGCPDCAERGHPRPDDPSAPPSAPQTWVPPTKGPSRNGNSPGCSLGSTAWEPVEAGLPCDRTQPRTAPFQPHALVREAVSLASVTDRRRRDKTGQLEPDAHRI